MKSTDIEARLIDLEGRYAFLEDLVNQLDEVVVRQQRSIDTLRMELQHTREIVARGQAEVAESDEGRPPHY